MCSLFLKRYGTECLFFPPVVRPVRILPRQAFTGGGIELSFPVSHSPVDLFPVLYEVRRDRNRVYVSCGEREIKFGMHWTVEYSLGDEDDFLCQRTVFANPDSQAHPWMSWSNAGVPARPDTEFHFPGGPVLVHDSEVRFIDWRAQGPKRQANVKRMTGYFWTDPDSNAFGVFTPSLQCGLYHCADRREMPGIKLWSDGVGRDEDWVRQYTLDGQQCLEIQAGPVVDQSIKCNLLPRTIHSHREFWMPSNVPRDIHKISVPQPVLRTIEEVPRFSWARDEEVAVWLNLISAYEARDPGALPEPPGLEDNRWAATGIAELGGALSWAASVSGANADRWLLQLGSWQAARGNPSAGLETLAQSDDDRARALCGRLYFLHQKDSRKAAACFRAIESTSIALHPQVVFDRDIVLAAIGAETGEERRRWLEATAALEDERLVERRAVWLSDCGDFQGAMNLLKNSRFQRIHQRYERTRLWRMLESKLGLPHEESLDWLGEDDLAAFGAYREYSNDGC